MKKILFLFSLIMLINEVHAQDEKPGAVNGFRLAGGINLALPTGDFSQTHSFGIGVELQPEYAFTSQISAYGSVGYTSFFGKKIDGFKVENVGLIPILAGARVYVAPEFFVGAKLGIGILTGGGESTSAFDYQPQIGYNADKFQINLGYNALTKNGATLANLSFGVLYKF